MSSPEIVLAAAAARTSQIHLGTAVTVLSSDDPVRAYERFATLDAVSGGRAEAIVGRGSFTESFPLFGYDLRDYEVLFDEKLDLFARLRDEQPVTWEGTTRAALEGADVYPKTESGFPVWVGVGGTPSSVVRTARYGFNLMLAIIGGAPARFRPFVDLYHRSLEQFGRDRLPIGVHSPGHIADSDEQAWEELYPAMEENRNAIGAERGWPPYSRLQFQHDVGPEGALFAGSALALLSKAAFVAASRRARNDVRGNPMSEVAVAPGVKPKKSIALSGVLAGNTALCTVGRSGNDLHYRGSWTSPRRASSRRSPTC